MASMPKAPKVNAPRRAKSGDPPLPPRVSLLVLVAGAVADGADVTPSTTWTGVAVGSDVAPSTDWKGVGVGASVGVAVAVGVGVGVASTFSVAVAVAVAFGVAVAVAVGVGTVWIAVPSSLIVARLVAPDNA